MNITGGKYNGRKLIVPDEKITRPTLSKTRMGVFNTLYSILGTFEDKSFLDLFGGSGIMGLEAISRGFKKVKVFEINRKSADVINENYKLLGLTPDIKVGDSLKLLNDLKEVYDVIYVDPPYKSGIYDDVLAKITKGLIITESSCLEDFSKYNVIKSKKYGSCLISYIER